MEDEIQAGLRAQGLPTKGKGNGGCGGPDRRGADDGNRRPASVKASLSVAFGQRAPNRAGTKVWKDERIKAADGSGGREREDRDRSRGAGDHRGAGGSRSRSRSRDRQRQDRYGDRSDRDRQRPNGRDHDR